MNEYNYYAKIIFEKVIDRSKTNEENIKNIAEYLKHRQFELVSSILQRIRKRVTDEEQIILDELD
jgi:fructose-1,6-bisphosphatase/sedoheptulose 1,7-bisphosphatase-like protein